MLTNMFTPMQPGRRSFLIGAGMAMAALPLLNGGEAEADVLDPLSLSPPPNKTLDSPTGMLETYIKMSGDTSGKPYGGYFAGHVFAWLPGKCITPLMGVTGFGLGSDHRQPDGSFHHIWHEVGFYTDLKTGRVLETWDNPLNGETCEVVPINNKSVNLTFSAHLPDPAKLQKAGYTIMKDNFTSDAADPAHPFGLPYAVIGDQLSVFSDAVGLVPSVLDPATWKKESPGSMINVGEFFMLTGSKKAALDPAVSNVPVTGSWTRLGPYLPWMLMGQSPGHIFYRTTTKKIAGPWELPKALQAYTKRAYPDFLEFPTDFSVPMENSWDVYKRTHTPKA
jgi:hypothetical protein